MLTVILLGTSQCLKVKYPICVNPTRELLKKVLEEWICEKVQIAVERKDVIYSLTAKTFACCRKE